MTPCVLVADDDEGVRYMLRGVLEDAGMNVAEAADGDAALDRVSEGGIHLVLTDLRMPGLDGLQLLQSIAALDDAPRVILMTAHGSERTAVEAMKHGAYDYFRKPFEPDELLAVVERAVEAVRLMVDNEMLEAELALSRSMVFGSASMKRLALWVHRFSDKDVTVLITGESGTGKERLAEAVVRSSQRRDAPFVRFNCAALSPELVDGELFGHEKGAFTGAIQSRRGLFREADGGTLFLDEVAELDLRAQAKLLRVLQEGEVRSVGSDRATPVDVRIIAATHRDLPARVEAGTFREDLFYRLNVVSLTLPPLRERPEDIELLARHFLEEFRQRFGGALHAPVQGLIARLRGRPWPGNIRELRNTIESLVALSPRGELDVSLLDDSAKEPVARASLEAKLGAYERGLIVAALERAHGNRSEAARQLGIGRATLYEKMAKYEVQ